MNDDVGAPSPLKKCVGSNINRLRIDITPWRLIYRPYQSIYLYVLIEFDPGMVGKGVDMPHDVITVATDDGPLFDDLGA